MSWRVLVLVVAIGGVFGLSACGGDGDDGGDNGASLEFADGDCIDRADLSFTDPSQAATPEVVDCGSPEAAGVLKEVDDYSKECAPGKGFESFTSGEAGRENTGNFCIEPVAK